MFIKIYVNGIENPLCVPISKAGVLCIELEKASKEYRLGKTV